MTLVDANVLLYAYDSESLQQAPAGQSLAAELSSWPAGTARPDHAAGLTADRHGSFWLARAR